MIGDPALAKGEVSKVADVPNGRVLHDEGMHGERCDVEKYSGDEHGDDTGHPAEDRERPRLRHDSQANLITTEQPCTLLPRHGTEGNLMGVIFGW